MTTSTTDAEAIARIIEAEIEHYTKGNIAWANGKRAANAILSYLASRETEPEYIYDDARFNKGVQHVVEMLARNLGVTDWVAGDGSESYDDDLWQTVLNILAAKGLYDADSGEFASRREAQEPVDWIYEDELPSSYPYGRMFAYSKVRDGVRMFPVYAPPAPAPAGEVERPTPNNRFSPRMLLLDDLHAVCVGGRWDGWKFWKHPDGQWVSLEKLAEEPRAALNGGRAE